MNIAWIAGMGALGTLCRYGVHSAMARWPSGEGFPWSTFLVNISGCLLAGTLTGWVAAWAGRFPEDLRLALMTGFLGGFTTFSAFSVDAVQLWDRGSIGAAAAYCLGSVLLGLGACVLGGGLGRWIAG